MFVVVVLFFFVFLFVFFFCFFFYKRQSLKDRIYKTKSTCVDPHVR